MLVSTRGRYALRVLVDMAEHQTEGYIPLREIAQRQDISEKYLENIIKTLVQNGVLTGLRGKGGGYRLNGSPADYTAGRILQMTENGLAPVECLAEGAKACPREAVCRTLDMWKKLDGMITAFLDTVTLADLMENSPE